MAAWGSNGRASVSAIASRADGGKFVQSVEALESEILPFCQYDVVEDRHSDRGSSCCAHFAAQ
eukprot:12013116-Alexandrium_andersonii.AAC.1